MKNTKTLKSVLVVFILLCLSIDVAGQETGELLTMEDIAVMQEVQKKKTGMPKNTFIINIGYGSTLSTIKTVYDEHKGAAGREYKIAYNWVSRSGFGFGLQCSALSTDVSSDMITLGYIAPSLVYANKISDRWIIRGDVGLGYAWHGAGDDKFSGLATNLCWSVEYMLSRVIGLGVGAQWWIASLSRSKGHNPDLFGEKDPEVNRIGIQGGLRFYF